MPKIVKVVLTQGSLDAPEGGCDGILIGDEAIKNCPNYPKPPGDPDRHKKEKHGITDRAKQPACILKDGVWYCTSVG